MTTGTLAAISAEIRKLIGLRACWVAATLGVVATPLVAASNGFAVRAATEAGRGDQFADASPADFGFNELSTVGLLTAIIIGVLAMSSEYRTDRSADPGGPQLNTTLTAVPQRPRLLFAKAAAVAAVVGAVSTVAVAATVGGSRLGLGSMAVPIDATVAARSGGAVLYWVLTAELMLSATIVVRNGVIPLAIGITNSAVISVSYLLTKVTHWGRFLPDTAGSALLFRDADTTQRLSHLSGGLVMALWVAAAFGGAATLFLRRDS